jgi:hypothetical protein
MASKGTIGDGVSGMTSGIGFTGESIRVIRRKPKPLQMPGGRKGIKAVMAAIGAIAVLTVVLVPALKGSAHSSNTLADGPCSDCHPAPTSTFLSFSNMPTSTYTPGLTYTITINIADANGATGGNAFDITVSAGTLASSDPNVEVLGNSTEAHTLVDTVASWTVKWTAPSSGSVKIETWAVYGEGQKSNSHWNQDVRTLSTTAIPEFPTLLLPVIGIAGVLLVVSRNSKKGAQ